MNSSDTLNNCLILPHEKEDRLTTYPLFRVRTNLSPMHELPIIRILDLFMKLAAHAVGSYGAACPNSVGAQHRKQLVAGEQVIHKDSKRVLLIREVQG